MINEGCYIEGMVDHSVLFQGTRVEAGAHIKHSVIMPDAVVGKGAYLEKVIVPPNVRIPDGVCIIPEEGSDEVILVTETFLESIMEEEEVQ